MTAEIPYGYCHCGCGQKTRLATETRASRGYIKGEPRRYIYNHHWQPEDEETRFWSKVDKDGPNGCWVWTAASGPFGYGSFQRKGRTRSSAHRVSYEFIKGPIPEGLDLDHLCRNPAFVNPAHLEPVTHAENVRRGTSPSARNAQKTHCKNGHPFDGDNLRIEKNGRRVCVTCHRAWRKKKRLGKRDV